MKTDRTWWKGSFPLWIVVMLLSLVGYAGRSILVNNDEFHARVIAIVETDSNRITRVEEQIKSIEEIKREVRDLNNWLRHNPPKP